MDRAACGSSDQRCMVGQCGDCSGERGVVDFIPTIGPDAADNMDDAEVRYKQWVTTDRCTLHDVIASHAECVARLGHQMSS